MIHRKKIPFDFFHLTLVLALIRLGPEILINDDYEGVALQMTQMHPGSTLSYRRLTHHLNPRFGVNFRLKTLDSVVDNFVSLREQLDYLSRVSWPRHNVIAYNPNVTSKSYFDDDERSNNAHSNSDSELSRVDGANHDPPHVSDNSAYELTPEDMDLIEILWKQDIDLGVSLDAFSQHQEIEKSKDPPDISESDFVRGTLSAKKELENADDSGYVSEKDEMCYTVDFETGEHIFNDQKLDDTEPESATDQSLFSTGEFDNISGVFLRSSQDPTFNANSLAQTVDLHHDFDTDSLPDIDLLFESSENLESMLKELNEVEEIEEETGTEMYPSMEEYWQDISTTLPLSVMSTSQACSLYPTRPSRTYTPDETEDYSGPAAAEVVMRPLTNDTFSAAMLQSSSFHQNSSDINNSYAYLPPLIGPTSLGCAVASSIATLTNDTDPLPDMVTAMNATFGIDLPGLGLPNQTSSTAANERLLSDLLMEEELQFMEVGNVHNQSVACSPRSRMDHLDLSSDSAASSSNASLSDYNENKRTAHYEELTSADYNGNESLYQTLKYCSSHPPTTSYRPSGLSPPHCDSTSHSVNFRNNYNHIHNHSYNLPPIDDSHLQRPMTRDKMREFQSDEEANHRDEKLAKALELPLSICDITNLAIDEFNEKLSKFELTEPQLTLIRDIRRRGKNKVAAQNCRKRKMDQISSLQHDLDALHSERLRLEAEQTRLLHQRHVVRTKYSQLCQIVLQSTNSRVPLISDTFQLSVANSSQTNLSETSHSSDIESPQAEKVITFNQGVRAKVKIEKKRYDY